MSTFHKPDESASKDALGLDIQSLKLSDPGTESQTEHTTQNNAPTSEPTVSESPDGQARAQQHDQRPAGESASAEAHSLADEAKPAPSRERKKPYINPERVKTGGTQRVCYLRSQRSSTRLTCNSSGKAH